MYHKTRDAEEDANPYLFLSSVLLVKDIVMNELNGYKNCSLETKF